MKKRLILTSILLCLITAACYDDDIDKLTDRIDALENTQIATLKEQVENIENTLPLLEKTDKELDSYINNLQETAANLQDKLTAKGVTMHLTDAAKELLLNRGFTTEYFNVIQSEAKDLGFIH